MACNNGNDRQLFGEDQLYFAEKRVTSLQVDFTRLCDEQLVNPRFPWRGRTRLFRIPLMQQAAAEQEVRIRGRIGFGKRDAEQSSIIFQAFRSSLRHIAEFERSNLHLDAEFRQVFLYYSRHRDARLAPSRHEQRELDAISFRIEQFRLLLCSACCKACLTERHTCFRQIEICTRQVIRHPQSISRREKTQKWSRQALQRDSRDGITIDCMRDGASKPYVIEPGSLCRIGLRMEIEPEVIGAQSGAGIRYLDFALLRTHRRIIGRPDAVDQIERTLIQTNERVVRVTHDLEYELIEVR